MARTALAAQVATQAGLEPAFTAANADGHWIDPDDLLYVKNGSGASIDVTIQTGATFRGKAVEEVVVAVPAGEDRVIGQLERSLFEQRSGAQRGKVFVDFSAVVTVTVAAIRQ